MPDAVRAAVAAGDEQKVMALCGDTFMSVPDLSEWIVQPGVVDWVRAFVGNDLRQYVSAIPGLQEDGSIQSPPSDQDESPEGGPTEGEPPEGEDGGAEYDDEEEII
jgi:hypothetical protein